jgi:hypothetical protein
MILKASQRGGPRQLAAHLLNPVDNDHVLVAEMRGFISGDLCGAMAETIAIARGTRCRQPILSLSLNPPKDADASIDDLTDAADRAEAALGLDGQPARSSFMKRTDAAMRMSCGRASTRTR